MFGRDSDLKLFQDRLFTSRGLTLLVAPTGAGKTSFLHAMVATGLPDGFFVVIHDEWPVDRSPSVALAEALRPPSLKQESSLLEIADAYRRGRAEKEPDSVPAAGARLVVILDQFEELFTYHSRRTDFVDFLQALSELCSKGRPLIHVVLSLRDDFIGELLAFDRFLPPLFNSYHHLTNLSSETAVGVIRSLSAAGGRKVDDEGAERLVADLQALEGSAASGSLDTDGTETGSEGAKAVVPSLLQIVCRALWRRSRTTDQPFLQGYRHRTAAECISSHVADRLDSLSPWEKYLAARALQYLVASRGSKVAHELSRLATRLRTRPKTLKHVLDGLLQARILRQVKGDVHSFWIQLYHDVYGPFGLAWARTTLKRFGQTALACLGLVAFTILITVSYRYLGSDPDALRAQIRSAYLDDPTSYGAGRGAYEELVARPAFVTDARREWSAAWVRRALAAERKEKRENALLYRLIALSYAPPEDRAAISAGILALPDLASVKVSFKAPLATDDRFLSGLLSPDERWVLGRTAGEQLWIWNSADGRVSRGPLSIRDLESSGAERRRRRFSVAKRAALDKLPPSQLRELLTVWHHPDADDFVIAGLLTGGDGDAVVLWRANDQSVLGWIDLRPATKALSLKVDDSGRYLACPEADRASLWEVSYQIQPVRFLRLQNVSPMTAVSFSHEPGTVLLLASHADGHLRIWDMKSGIRFDAGAQSATVPEQVFLAGRDVWIRTTSDRLFWRVGGTAGSWSLEAGTRVLRVDAGKATVTVLDPDRQGASIRDLQSGRVLRTRRTADRSTKLLWATANETFGILAVGSLRLATLAPEASVDIENSKDVGELVKVWARTLGECVAADGSMLILEGSAREDSCAEPRLSAR